MKRIVYCLTNRGLYSELSNLALARLYASFYRLEFVVNTRMWNARIRHGLSDYFIPTIEETNSLFTAQDNICTKKSPRIREIYYRTANFFMYYFLHFLNLLFLVFHPDTILAKDVFSSMCSEEFIEKFDMDDFKVKFSSSFKSIYKYNKSTEDYIGNRKKQLHIPSPYMAVHIRRGDKITSREMDNIELSVYLDKIIEMSEYYNYLYVATDDCRIVDYFDKSLKNSGVFVYSNLQNTQNGFVESEFNKKDVKAKKSDVLNMLFDMDMLINSSYFIGTYSSNIGRIVPLYIGFEKCFSVDVKWNVLYGI